MYVLLATAELVQFVSTAITLIVFVLLTVIAPLYKVLKVVGLLPSVV